jgi:hypothetical protein
LRPAPSARRADARPGLIRNRAPAEVGLLTGCVQSILTPRINAATVPYLAA